MTASNENSEFWGTSTGHSFGASEWLDVHFTAMQPEYEEMLRWVGIQPGWHVLDAACGSGSFLPLMTELVGKEGHVSAIDLAPENVHMVGKRTQLSQWVAPVSVRVGNILTLPYENQSFDAVWCANTTEYLNDDELMTLLNEFRRVVRPGGLVAIKEYDFTAQQLQPLQPQLFPHFHEAMIQAGSAYFKQAFRTIDLQRWLRNSGLFDLRQKPTLMTRFQPISPSLKKFVCDLLKYLSANASKLDLQPEELRIWAELAEVDSPKHIIHDPDFQYRTIQTIFVGKVP